MCYSEFGEIIDYICQMDFDCITIEATRSKGDIIKDFKKLILIDKLDLEFGIFTHQPYLV